jgi:predicted nucleotidyltransferase
VLREDFRPDSDVDVLVEFQPGHTVGLFRMAGLEMELSEALGRKVDLRTPAELSRYFRDEVARTSEVQYAQE